jgi:hypothetical protein
VRVVKPLLITTKAVFHSILREAMARTDKMAGADPGFGVFAEVRRQLAHMQQCVAGGRVPTDDEKALVDVGPLAVRNFEESDEEYASWLKELDYAFRRWQDLPAPGDDP